jgi:hypothetical protein
MKKLILINRDLEVKLYKIAYKGKESGPILITKISPWGSTNYE